MIKTSLGTKDVTVAKRRVPPLALQTDQEFQAAKARKHSPVRAGLSDREIDFLTADYLNVRLAEDETHRIVGSKEDDDLYKAVSRQVAETVGTTGRWSAAEATTEIGLSERTYQKTRETLEFVLPALREKLGRGDTSIVTFDAEVFLDKHGIKLDPTSASYRKLCHEFLKVSIKTSEAILRRLDGEIVDTPPPPGTSPVRPSMTQIEGDLRLMGMFGRWLNERRPPTKTELDFTTAIRRFTELHGDLLVSEITKSHVRAYKEAIARLPRACSGKMRKMTLPQVLEHLDASPVAPSPTLAPGTINKAVGALQTVLRWVERQGYLDDQPNWSNPAANMKVHNPAEQEDNRLPYDPADLKAIFGCPVFCDGERPRAGGGEAAKWLPLIALFSGAREEEIGQALVTDVQEEDGIAYLDINTLDRRAGKRVKNKSSRRKLPLHPELLRCGLLEYIEERRRAGDERLFPGLRPSVSGQITGNWSKWWSRYTDNLGITDHRKVFHSFRHAFKDACRDAEIAEEVHDALTGHTTGSVGRKYGGGVPLKVLAEAVAKIGYKGLDLSHLHGAVRGT